MHDGIVFTRFKDSRSSMLEGNVYVFHENGALEIHTSQPINSGKYTCVARNNLGISENHVYLEVKGERSALFSSADQAFSNYTESYNHNNNYI